jgi:hypothetical protein
LSYKKRSELFFGSRQRTGRISIWVDHSGIMHASRQLLQNRDYTHLTCRSTNGVRGHPTVMKL